MLTPEQERFLTEFYRLCDRYKQVGIVSYSRGLAMDYYEVVVTIDLLNSHKKDLDGAGLNS